MKAPQRISGCRSRLLPALLAVCCVAGCGPVSDDTPQQRASGETTYLRYCYSCHASGAAGAPRLGDREAWAPRLAQGMDVLLEHTVNGLAPGMPAMGLCKQCDDEDLRAAISYMAAQAGGMPAAARGPAEETSKENLEGDT